MRTRPRTFVRRSGFIALFLAGLLVSAAACSDDDANSSSDGSDATTTTTNTAASADGDDSPGDAAMSVSTSAWDDGAAIPAEFTCDGQNEQPPVSWDDVPDDVAELVLIVDDPDAPGGSFIHWVIWGLAPEGQIALGEVPDTAVQGNNGLGEPEWFGPCPPPGPAHTYEFQLTAVSEAPDIPPGAEADAVRTAIEGITVGSATMTGTYERAG